MANANTGKKPNKMIVDLLGLILLIAVIWAALAIVKGILSIVITLLCVAAAVVLAWRLVKAVSRK